MTPDGWAVIGVGAVLLLALLGIGDRLKVVISHLQAIQENTFDKEKWERDRGWD